MIAIAVALLFIAAVLFGIAAKQWNIQRSFALISTLPTMLCVGSFLGLLHDSNSLVFYEGFVLGLLSSVLLTGSELGLLFFDEELERPYVKRCF